MPPPTNHHSILSLYHPIDPIWGDITQLLKPTPPSTPTPLTISATPNLRVSDFYTDDPYNATVNISHTPPAINNTLASVDKKVKESWSKGRAYGRQEVAMKQARKEAAALAGMKFVMRQVVDIAPCVECVEEEVDTETETEKEGGVEMVIWTPDTSKKYTDEEEEDLLELETPDRAGVALSEEGIHDELAIECVDGMTPGSDFNSVEREGIETVEGDLGLGAEPAGEKADPKTNGDPPAAVTAVDSCDYSLELAINTETACSTQTDTLFNRFGIPSMFRIQPVEPDFYTTRTLPTYPLSGSDIESSDALLLGPLSDCALNEWKQDHGRRYIMDKVRGVFSTILHEDNSTGEMYIRVEFHSRHMRDNALRVFGGVVDGREGPLFLKGGYPCGGGVMFAWKWREMERV